MTKFIAREKEVVEAFQFTGGEKDGTALVSFILNGQANARWFPQDRHHPENIHIVGDNFSERMYVGDWLVFLDDDHLTNMTKDDFEAKYEKIKFPRVTLIWKDIPGFPNWQVSDNGRVRDVRFHGYKQRTKDGDFILHRDGKAERWSEAQLGDEEQIKAFFNN